MGKLIQLLFIVAILPLVAMAQNTEVVAPPINGGTGLNPGQPGGACALCKVRLIIHPKCYGTNLRRVSNPISPGGKLTMKLKFQGRNEIKVEFPGRVTSKNPSPPLKDDEVKLSYGDSVITPRPKISAGLIDGEIRDFPVRGQDGKKLVVEYLQFHQEVDAAYGKFYATNGPVTNVNQNVEIKTNNSVIIDAALPGQQDYCGGFHSPLMVFFDNARPKFDAISDFPINGKGLRRNWPESGSPGYFLVTKSAGVKKVSKRNDIQLFEGGTDAFKSGFEMLAQQFDSDKDGSITAKDKRFNELFLWRDPSGKGNPKEADLLTLDKAGLVSIDLGYKIDSVNPIANRAEERERSSFKFKDAKSGKIENGAIIDMWFAAID